jgi:hypothetical protein
MQLKKITIKIFYNFDTWLYRDSTNQLQSFAQANDFYSHGSLCKQDEIIVLNDALPQLVSKTFNFFPKKKRNYIGG